MVINPTVSHIEIQEAEGETALRITFFPFDPANFTLTKVSDDEVDLAMGDASPPVCINYKIETGTEGLKASDLIEKINASYEQIFKSLMQELVLKITDENK